MNKLIHKICAFTAFSIFSSMIYAAPINVVAAENFYGQLAKEIGGNQISVTSIMDNPNTDPHFFSTSPKTNEAIVNAQVIVYNGVNYDDWMTQLLNAQKTKTAKVINVGQLVKIKDDANPHIWYKPGTMETLAQELTTTFSKIDPSHTNEFKQNLKTFLANQVAVTNKINELKKKYKGTPVTATEPVYGYMADAIGLKMEGTDVQWKIMNDTEPSPKMFADYLALLNNHTVKAVFYNSQTAEDKSKQILAVANKNNVPVIGVTETMPNNMTISKWFISGLTSTDFTLSSAK